MLSNVTEISNLLVTYQRFVRKLFIMVSELSIAAKELDITMKTMIKSMLMYDF